MLAGSDLLTSLTSTFDRKWKSLNPSATAATPTITTTFPSSSTSTSNYESFANGKKVVKIESEKIGNEKGQASEMYRDPSLHKAPLEIAKSIRLENVRFTNILLSELKICI